MTNPNRCRNRSKETEVVRLVEDTVLKTAEGKTFVGSSPTASANIEVNMDFGTDELALMLDLLESERQRDEAIIGREGDREFPNTKKSGEAESHLKVVNGAIDKIKKLLIPEEVP